MSSITKIEEFVWSGLERAEIYNQSTSIKTQLFSLGEKRGSVSNFFTKDHLYSTREVTDNAGSIQNRLSFTLDGQAIQSNPANAPTVGYASYFHHDRSDLDLTAFRQHSPKLGRFLSRDPAGKTPNRYDYADNNPISNIDPLGLDAVYLTRWGGVSYLHTGLMVMREGHFGVWIDAMPNITNGNLEVFINNFPLPLTVILDIFPLTTDPKIVAQILQDAFSLQDSLRRSPLQYGLLPGWGSGGYTSNQITQTLLNRLGKKLLFAPGSEVPFPPRLGGIKSGSIGLSRTGNSDGEPSNSAGGVGGWCPGPATAFNRPYMGKGNGW